MILIYFGFGLMTVAAVTAITLNSKLIKRNKELLKDNEDLRNDLATLSSGLVDYARNVVDLQQLPNTETFMEERTKPIPHFAVYRKGLTGKIDLLHIGYKADDPDDREYKRIFAQERVDALNEKP